MELKVKLDPDQLNDLIKASLVEYHQYLHKAVWHDEEDYRMTVRDALLITLEQYQTPSEHEAYLASLLN